uniref:Plant thionin family protein n=1 Tax=Manihot esculenta TaxID=3983 RepID=A0A2C9UF37_MANES
MGKRSLVILMSLLFLITCLEGIKITPISECVKECMPICMRLYKAVTLACEHGCFYGCQQLQVQKENFIIIIFS